MPISKTKIKSPLARLVIRTRSSKEAAAMLGVSETQLRRILMKAKWNAALPARIKGLDIRTANVLLAAGFENQGQVRDAIEQGVEIFG